MNKSYLIPAICTVIFFTVTINWSPAKESQVPSLEKFCREGIYEYRDGKSDANRMLRAGRLGVVSYGLPVPWVSDYQKILFTEYQIEHRLIAGCVVSEEIANYTRNFNGVMDPVIKAKFGPEVFADTSNAARIRYQDRINTEGLKSLISDATPARE